MALLDYNEVTLKKYVVVDGEPYEVVDSHVARTQMRKPTNKTKLKSLISGRVIEQVFQVSDRVEEADISKKPITFLYKNEKKAEFWFSWPDNPKDRFVLDDKIVGDQIKYIKEKSEVEAQVFTLKDGEEKIIGIKYPMKVDLRVVEAPPSIKGDTATGGTKVVVLETGATVNAPLFINEGELIKVNIETGEYSERVNESK
ncbi:MAG TPA: hypothetical protein VGE63_00685 [Candidatus Paceibacterota bacterium]